jgi:Trp operon repressor
MNFQDVVLAMTVGSVEVARTGHEALVNGLIESGLTEDEARSAVNEVIQIRLAPTARKARVQQLHDAGMTQRQIAAAVGVSLGTVNADVFKAEHKDTVPEREDEPEAFNVEQDEAEQVEAPIGNNPELWTDLVNLIEMIEAASSIDAPLMAVNVPIRRRAATARKLRRLGTYMGSIALSLERMEQPK